MKTENQQFLVRKYPKKQMRRNRRWQQKAYNFLERPTGLKCFVYHVFVFMLVLVCLMLSVLPSDEIDTVDNNNKVLLPLEYALVVIFGTEYVVRLWSVGCVGKYSGIIGRLRFAKQPICLIDLGVVLAGVMAFLIGTSGNTFAASAIRFIRFLQILRILHVDRQGGTWRMLGSVVYEHRQELITTLYIGFLALIFSSYFVYLAEHKPKDDASQPSNAGKFQSYADALWWGVVTVTTIGYGDYVPKTWLGKTIASCFSIFAISFFALPAGTLGSGFALKVQQKQRQKQFNRQIPAAAKMIQASWRLYAVDEGTICVATWKNYEVKTYQESKSPNDGNSSSILDSQKRALWKKFSFQKQEDEKTTAQMISNTLIDFNQTQAQTSSNDSVLHINNQPSLKLSKPQRLAVRAIRTLTYLVAKKRFQIARRPYELKDLVETSTQGHADTRLKIKELQRRLDQTIGKPLSFAEGYRIFNSPAHHRQRLTVAGRLYHLEQWTKNVDEKLNNIHEILMRCLDRE